MMKNAKVFGMMAMGGALALSLAGCGVASIPGPLGTIMKAGRGIPVSIGSDNDGGGVARAAKEKLDDQVSIDEDCWFRSNDDIHHVVVFTNNSSKTVEVSTNSEALDDGGNILGVGKGDIGGVGPGCKGVIHEAIEDARGTVSFDTKLSATADQYTESVVNLRAEASINNKKTIVKITNDDRKNAENLDANILFFKDGKLVGFDKDDYSLGDLDPGETVSDEYSPLYCDDDYKTYDSVEAIVVGSSESE